MLIAGLSALILILFSGGSGDVGIRGTFAQIEPLVNKCVKEPERQKQAVAVAKQLNEELESFFADMKKFRQKLAEIDGNYDATEEEFWKLYDESDAAWKESEKKMLDLRFQLKETMTREEWAELFKGLEKTL